MEMINDDFRRGSASLFHFLIRPAAVVALIALSAIKATAQEPLLNKPQLQQVLHSYFTLKDALVSDNPQAAAGSATVFIKNLHGISYRVISEGNVTSLVNDASAIADSGDIETQRQSFANLSSNMAEVAKALKLTDQPVYIQYCPMKKATWLSSNKAVTNPYYGSAMLTCGMITDTIQ
jgi:hypothetical protein